jgi:hypothetical protein
VVSNFSTGIPNLRASPIQGDGGPATLAPFSGAISVAADGEGGVYCTDAAVYTGHTVRHVWSNGTSQIVAGIAETYDVVTNDSAVFNVTFSGDGGPAT